MFVIQRMLSKGSLGNTIFPLVQHFSNISISALPYFKGQFIEVMFYFSKYPPFSQYIGLYIHQTRKKVRSNSVTSFKVNNNLLHL
jgi:hypothetical protein